MNNRSMMSGCDHWGDCHRTKDLHLDGPLLADSVEKVGFGFHGRKVHV